LGGRPSRATNQPSRPTNPNPDRDDHSTHRRSTLHPPLDATLFTSRRHVGTETMPRVWTCRRTHNAFTEAGWWRAAKAGRHASRLCRILSYPFRYPFPFLRLLDLSADMKRERERERSPTAPSDEHSRVPRSQGQGCHRGGLTRLVGQSPLKRKHATGGRKNGREIQREEVNGVLNSPARNLGDFSWRTSNECIYLYERVHDVTLRE